MADCVNVPQRSYCCAFGPFPCQSQKALGHRANLFYQRLRKKIISGNVNFDEAALYIMDEEGKATGGTIVTKGKVDVAGNKIDQPGGQPYGERPGRGGCAGGAAPAGLRPG